MKPARLDELSDGIFAIVMTIIVFEIKVPAMSSYNDLQLWIAIKSLLPSLIAYMLSFALLFTYWRGHHFFVSVYAKNIDTKLTNINALFFMLVALVPFSSNLLGHFSQSKLAIIIFGIHTVLIGLSLFWMRNYVLYSEHIKNPEISKREIRGSTIRTLVPVIFSLIAIPLSFYSWKFALSLFSLAIVFNLFPYSTKLFDNLTKGLNNIFYKPAKDSLLNEDF
ncbi:MAG: TMEM175 family protein [Candidatus Paceibacterota bacterium]|jgi:uncharacterized membrane protein